jgi:hypothetical protein
VLRDVARAIAAGSIGVSPHGASLRLWTVVGGRRSAALSSITESSTPPTSSILYMAAGLPSRELSLFCCRFCVFERRSKAGRAPALDLLSLSSTVSSCGGVSSRSSMRMGYCAYPGLDLMYPSSPPRLIKIGFSGDPSPDDVVLLGCSFYVSPPSSSKWPPIPCCILNPTTALLNS